MATFDFYQDQKHTVWDRHYFSIEASSYEEAVEKVRSIRDTQVTDNETDGVNFKECRTLYDTMELLSPEDNGGCSTLEMFDANGTEIANNAE